MEGEFRRALGPWSAGALIAGSIIGVGIFLFVADVAARLPSGPAILAVWTAGAVVASCGSLCLAELAAAYPQTGGIYVFLRRAYGPFVAFLYSWAKLLITRPGSFAILALGFARFAGDFLGLGADAPPWMGKAMAVGAVVALTGINIVGVRAGAGVQNVLTAIKVLCLAAVIGVGAAFAAGALGAHPVAIQAAEAPTGSAILLFGTALVAVMWAFGGWDEAPFVAEEVRQPERNLPLAILGGLWLTAVLFVAVNAAYLAILSPAELAASGGQTALVAMQRALGGGAGRMLSLALMISALGAANGLALTGGRIAFATGRDQPLFRWFARTHPATKTPVRGLVLQAVLTIAVMLALPNPFQLLLYTGLAYWAFAGLTALAVIVLRRREPGRERPFRVWAYPVVPVLFAAASAGMGLSVALTSPRNALAAVVILAVGAAAFAVQALCFRERE